MKQLKNVISFWTAESKKVTIGIVILISVIIDKVFLKDILYGQDLFSSKVFQGEIFFISLVVAKDIQTIISDFKKLKSEITK